MVYYTKAAIKAIEKKIIGSPNEDSQDELNLYSDIRRAVRENPQTKYQFHLNVPITALGVATKIVKLREYHAEFIKFLMGRCRVSEREAIELTRLLRDDPIRTNALKLDAGKVFNGKLVQALEINGSRHYCVPDDVEEQRSFVRSVFCDMIKLKEMERICPITEINTYSRSIGCTSSADNLEMDTILYNFVNEI